MLLILITSRRKKKVGPVVCSGKAVKGLKLLNSEEKVLGVKMENKCLRKQGFHLLHGPSITATPGPMDGREI